jgi:hypothetical protein
MFRKRDDAEAGRMSATGDRASDVEGEDISEGVEGRMSATGASSYGPSYGSRGSSGGSSGNLERRVDTLTSGAQRGMQQAGEAAGNLGAQASDVGRSVATTAGRKVAEVQDMTAQRLGDAQEAVTNALQEVEIEEFRVRGNIAGYPFALDLEDEGGDRFIAFEVNLRTDAGDTLRISGRKSLAGMATGNVEGNVSGSLENRSGSETSTIGSSTTGTGGP